MNNVLGSSGYVVSRDKSKCIVHNTYTDRRINPRLKPTPIHGPFNKSIIKCSYYKRHFHQLSQSVSKRLDGFLSQRLNYDYIIIDPIVTRFSPNALRSHIHIFDHSIITFGGRFFYIDL